MFAIVNVKSNQVVLTAATPEVTSDFESVIEAPKIKIENGLLEITGLLRHYKFNDGYIKLNEVEQEAINYSRFGKPFIKRGFVLVKGKLFIKITMSNFTLMELENGRNN